MDSEKPRTFLLYVGIWLFLLLGLVSAVRFFSAIQPGLSTQEHDRDLYATVRLYDKALHHDNQARQRIMEITAAESPPESDPFYLLHIIASAHVRWIEGDRFRGLSMLSQLDPLLQSAE